MAEDGEGTPLELGAVNEFLGLGSENLEGFRADFETTFIRRDNVKQDDDLIGQITGKKMGLVEQDVRGVFKNSGFALDGLETKGKKVEELVAIGLANTIDDFKTKISELENGTLKDKDERFLELEKKFETSTRKLTEETELRKVTASEFALYKEESANKFKGNTISTLKNQAWTNAKFKQSASDLEMEGFRARIDKKVTLDIDDKGQLFPTDLDGSRIPNPAVSGTFMSYDDVIRAESISSELYPLNEKSKDGKVSNQSLRDVESASSESGRTVNRTFRG